MTAAFRFPVFCVAALALFALPAGAAAPTQARGRDSTTVILLGTGMPYPDHLHQGPATVVQVGGRLFLFDCGAGVERQMEAAGLPIRGTWPTVFLTHLHSDHTLGLPDLLLTSWVMRRA